MTPARRQRDPEVEDPLIATKGLAGRAFINAKMRIAGIIQLVREFQVDITEESSAETGLGAYIPAPELKTLVIRMPKQAILHMRDDGADACLAQEIYF